MLRSLGHVDAGKKGDKSLNVALRMSDRMKEDHCYTEKKKNSVALVRERTIPKEWPPPVGEVSANFCG